MFLVGFVTIIFVVTLAVITWWYYIFCTYRRYLKAFPVFRPIPLFGATYKVFSTVDVCSIILRSPAASKNVYGMLGFIPILWTSDPKIFSLVLKSPKYINKPSLYTTLENMVGKSLLLVNGNEWRQQRKLLNTAVDYGNLLLNIPIFNDRSDALVKAMAEEINKESTELDGFIEYWSLLQSYETMLGGDLPLQNRLRFLEAVKHIMKIAIERCVRINEFFNITYVFSKNYWLERKLIDIISTHLRVVLENRKRKYCNEDSQRGRLFMIDILLKQMETDKNITDAFIVSELTLMISAGFETTAMTVQYALYNLARFPEIQQKVYEEVFSILGDDINQSISHQHINEMAYLDLVIKESMRLITSVPMFLRQLDEDLNYEGTILPKGLTILFASYAMHLDPDLYPDPENFVPERFLPENLNKNKYSYVPFCGGPRNCIGQKYAMLAMKICFAKILLNYKLVEVNQALCFSYEITLKSKTGIRVGFRRRN